MENVYRELGLKSVEHHDAYNRMADIIAKSTKRVEADSTELEFITNELEIATGEFTKGVITEDHFDAILKEHVECLERWVRESYVV